MEGVGEQEKRNREREGGRGLGGQGRRKKGRREIQGVTSWSRWRPRDARTEVIEAEVKQRLLEVGAHVLLVVVGVVQLAGDPQV